MVSSEATRWLRFPPLGSLGVSPKRKGQGGGGGAPDPQDTPPGSAPVYMKRFTYDTVLYKVRYVSCNIVYSMTGPHQGSSFDNISNLFLSGGAGTPTREPLCLHVSVHTMCGLKTDTPRAHLDG